MNPFLWDGYADNEPNEKIRYWVDAWETMIEPPSGLNLGLEMFSAHLIIRSVRDEVVFNNFANPDNRAFLKRKLEEFAEHDPASKRLFGADIALIRREFGGTRCEFIEQLCRSVDESYKSSAYLDALYAKLREVLDAPVWSDGDTATITRISQYMIVEMVLIGYSFKTIKELPGSLFERTSLYHSRNPARGKVDNAALTSDGIVDQGAYHAALETATSQLTISDRLDYFRTYFEPKAEESILIYQLDGLKGQTVDISIGHVNIYSPRAKRYIKSVPGRDQQYLAAELFGMADDHAFANAAVRLVEIDTSAATEGAIADIEKALDLLGAFLAPRSKLRVRKNRYIRVSADGMYFGGGERGESRSDESWRHFQSADLSGAIDNQTVPTAVGVFGAILFGDQRGAVNAEQVAYSLHWHRKAVEAGTPEDQLLGYWIALESLVRSQTSPDVALSQGKKDASKASLIQEFASAVHVCFFVARAAMNLYRYLDQLMLTKTNGRAHLSVPSKEASKWGLGSGTASTIVLADFVQSLDGLAGPIERKVVNDAIKYVQRLHTDPAFALAEVERVGQSAKDDLLLIYRLRNWIVHKAYHDHRFLPHYVEKAREYCGNTLRQVLHDLSSGRAATVEASLMRYYVRVARLKEQLKSGKMVNLLELDY